MNRMYKIPLLLEAQDAGGWTITSPLIPELITEVDALESIDAHLKDAIAATIELYQDMGRPFPAEMQTDRAPTPVQFETLVVAEA
ncbi:antitoxin HicB [Desulfonatronum zhilinae]|nr:antitoxin HicB [Desulfonatronum zhilinae]